MAERRREHSALPRRVREYEVEQAAFLSWLLLLKQIARPLRQLQQHDPLREVVLVGRLVLVNLPLDGRLLIAPLRAFLAEEGGVDLPVELVDVHGGDTLLELRVLRLQPGNCFFVVKALVYVAFAKGLREPAKHLVIKLELAQNAGELRLQHRLRRVGLPALLLEAGATVVDVLGLLDVPHESAPAVTALDEAGECEVVLHRSRLGDEYRPLSTA